MIRRADHADLDAVVAVFVASRTQAAVDGLIPPIVGTGEGLRAFLARTLDDAEVWVEDDGGRLAAMLVLVPGWIEHLYVHPDDAGHGIGSRLLELAKERLGALELWTFQANSVARAFYTHRGLTEVEFTDGANNMEHAPDVRLAWAPVDRVLAPADGVP